MKALRLIWVAAALMGLAGVAAQAAPGPWEQPAAELADQIAAILGPGQAHLTIRNLSTIPNDEIPVIRRLLTQDLKTHGVVLAGAESANTIRVTLSESAQKRMLVAEVGEGTQTQVAMVDSGPIAVEAAPEQERMSLRKERFAGPYELSSLPCYPEFGPPVLAVAERQHGLIVLKQNCLLALDRSPKGFFDGKGFYRFGPAPPGVRDPRGLLTAGAEGDDFAAYIPGTACSGTFAPTEDPNRPPGEGWTVNCHPSDDPWPIAVDTSGAPQLKAFYNPARNYFTGVVSPSVGVDLPPFYSAALLPRSAGNAALLIGGIDGRVQLAENGALKTVSGTRDWGSDFAVLHSGCGAGVQVIASSSGEAANDSLRAYELPALEAVPASAPLAIDGTVTALWNAPDGKSVLAVVRNAANQYEVDRVTALCN